MPDVAGMSHYPDGFTPGRDLHKSKKPKKSVQKGCKNNNNGPHEYVSVKFLHSYNASVTFAEVCMFCDRYKLDRSLFGKTNPKGTIEATLLVSRQMFNDTAALLYGDRNIEDFRSWKSNPVTVGLIEGSWKEYPVFTIEK